jgi:hypothetical protein
MTVTGKIQKNIMRDVTTKMIKESSNEIMDLRPRAKL